MPDGVSSCEAGCVHGCFRRMQRYRVRRFPSVRRPTVEPTWCQARHHQCGPPVIVCDMLSPVPHSESGRFLRYIGTALGHHGGSTVIAKVYFARQAAIMFGIAKATKDPKMSAALMDKAADVKSRVDELGAPLDLTPIAPDIEQPAN